MTSQALSLIEDLAYQRISRYNKPVKTKHLARSLNVSRPELVKALNSLKDKGLVLWFAPARSKDIPYGWKKTIHFDPLLSEIVLNGFIIKK